MTTIVILTAPVLLPVILGVLPALCKPLANERPRRTLVITALVINALLAIAQVFSPGLKITFISLTDKLPLVFSADAMGGFFNMLVAVMYLPAGIFSLGYMKQDDRKGRFYSFFLITLGMLNGMGLAGNLMTLFLFFEALTLLSLPLVIHTMTKEAIAAAFKYLFYSLAGSSLALVGFLFVHNYGTTLEFRPGGVLDTALLGGNDSALYIAVMLAVVGFGAKAGMFPLHAWLPSAHPVAPSPASAILSGVITKAGVLAIIRFIFYIVGPDFLRGTWVQTTWIVLSLISIVLGSMLAYREPVLKKRLAYSSISQVSYVLFGLFTLSAGGVLGGLFHMVSHSIIKTSLFLIAGAIAFKTEKTSIADLRDTGKRMPVTLSCFTLASIALVGIPPTSGFISKWNIAEGSLSADIGVFSWFGPAILLLSALLTAGYLLPISISAFFSGEKSDTGKKTAPAGRHGSTDPEVRRKQSATALPGDDREYSGGALSGERNEVSPFMLAPIIILAALAVLAGVFPGGLMAFFERIVNAVMGIR